MALTDAERTRITARLESYYAAEQAILRNQSYKMPDNRELTRTNLKDVQTVIKQLEDKLDGGSDTPLVRGRARRFVNMSR